MRLNAEGLAVHAGPVPWPASGGRVRMPSMRTRFTYGLLILGLALLGVAGSLAACGRQPQSGPAGGASDARDGNSAGNGQAAEAGPKVRIITLAPAITQMLVDMGLAHDLVGVARNDMAAPPGLPIVGDVFDINTEAILKLKPTLVLLMTTKEGPPTDLINLGRQYGFQVVAYPSPKSVEDVSDVIFDMDQVATASGGVVPGPDAAPKRRPRVPCLGTVLHEPARAQSLWLEMLMRLGKLEKAVAGDTRPRVLMLLSTQPLMAIGPGATHDQLLSFVNASNAAEDAQVEAPTLDREKILAMKPDVILLLLPNAPPLQPLGRDPRLAALTGLDVPAVSHNRIYLINDPLVLLPSSSLPRIAAEMARDLHPDRIKQIDQAMTQSLVPSEPAPSTSQPASGASGPRPTADDLGPLLVPVPHAP